MEPYKRPDTSAADAALEPQALADLQMQRAKCDEERMSAMQEGNLRMEQLRALEVDAADVPGASS